MNTSPPLRGSRIRRILVADDEELVRSLLVRYLEHKGFQVVFTGDGKAALELFRREPFDLVLSDMRMPSLDGLKLLTAIKEINSRVPVVLISGYGDVETVVAALKAGAENFLAKPLKMESLGRVVEQALSISCLGFGSQVLVPQVRQVTYLQAPSKPEYICEMVQQVALSAVAVGYATFDLDNNLKLALVEGITNAMEHGNRWDAGKKVSVKSEVTKDLLRLTIKDEGPGFDVHLLPDPTVSDHLLAERGRGVFLMQAIMDEVTYNEQGNQLTLVKRRQERVPHAVQAKA